jgi:hypothetical protein
MSIAFEDELENLRQRLRKMSEEQLIKFGSGREKSVPRPEMSGGVQAAVGRGACGVETEASESAVTSVPGASPRRAASPAYLDDLTQIMRDGCAHLPTNRPALQPLQVINFNLS